ncbi:hypothetical protein B0A49_13069, partial [Cryomyces minteri]
YKLHNETSQSLLNIYTPIGAGTQAEFISTRDEKHRSRNETSQPLSMIPTLVSAGTQARFPPGNAERDQKHKATSHSSASVPTPAGAGTQAGPAPPSRAEHETRPAPSRSPRTVSTPVGAGTQAASVTSSTTSAPEPTAPAPLSTPGRGGDTQAPFLAPITQVYQRLRHTQPFSVERPNRRLVDRSVFLRATREAQPLGFVVAALVAVVRLVEGTDLDVV